jgi:L-serine dehydratase
MDISVFDLFTIGIGPSSSHSVGPMRAANRFVDVLRRDGIVEQISSIRVELFGSLALTGKGHGTDNAILLGLEGETPEQVDPDEILPRATAIRETNQLTLAGGHVVGFRDDAHLLFRVSESLPGHANAMRFTATGRNDNPLCSRVFYSIGGGFVVAEEELNRPTTDDTNVKYPFRSAADLLAICDETGLPLSQIALENERAFRSDADIRAGLLKIWDAMQACVKRGCLASGVLPGQLGVVRRAPILFRELCERPESSLRDPLSILDWVDLYALAVNEENAAGGRVVTAPTNGAAGIIPAVLHYYERFVPTATQEGVIRFLLTAGCIAMLYKRNASISGAEVGCQGEVGVACSMAAGALTEVLGGTPAQVEEAAEIGMEHNLGLTCDPVAGLVQVPCIERNAMGAIKAMNASRLALRSDGAHHVSLDQVIETMRQTGADMQHKYKETSLGGLAVHVVQC